MTSLAVGATLGLISLAYASKAPDQGQHLLTVVGHPLTRDRVPAVPLAVAGFLCVANAFVTAARWPLPKETARFGLAGILGFAGTWWVTAQPIPEGPPIVQLSYNHSLMACDLVAVPLFIAALALLARPFVRPSAHLRRSW